MGPGGGGAGGGVAETTGGIEDGGSGGSPGAGAGSGLAAPLTRVGRIRVGGAVGWATHEMTAENTRSALPNDFILLSTLVGFWRLDECEISAGRRPAHNQF
jgi:hypothetical protein